MPLNKGKASVRNKEGDGLSSAVVAFTKNRKQKPLSNVSTGPNIAVGASTDAWRC